VLLLGSDLPHLFRNGHDFFKEKSKQKAEAIVIYFKEDFAGKTFWELPEALPVKELLSKAKRGIKIVGNSKKEVISIINETGKVSGIEKILLLIRLLNFISISAQYDVLASSAYNPLSDQSDMDKINMVSDYVMKKLKTNIRLTDAASIANMSPTAFCRFFKSKTNKTFIKFLNEIRVGHACRMLIDGKMSASEIGYDSGYNNLTNFNIQFKRIMNMAPLEYRRLFKY
jgi:AraC-like DNA-binding protein